MEPREQVIALQDFSRPSTFELSRRKPDKTVDIGRDGTSASTDPRGRILQLSTFHPEHGIVVAVPFEQFDGSKFHDPLYVRSYRTRLLQYIQAGKSGFGLSFDGYVQKVAIHILKWNIVQFEFRLGKTTDVSYTVQVLKGGEVVQTAVVKNHGPSVESLAYNFDLSISINRASYGQLTEGGPIPIPESRNMLQFAGGNTFNIVNPCLGAHLKGSLEVDHRAIKLDHLEEQEQLGSPIVACYSGAVEVAPNSSRLLRARFQLLPTTALSQSPLRNTPDELVEHIKLPRWREERLITTYMLRRNVDYILANCAVPVSDTDVALMTDHVALPLGWNRDNYWQVRLLLETHRNLDSLIYFHAATDYSIQIKRIVKGHLSWVFTRAERPHGFWHRSYLVTGKPKDRPIFQLDQQCYPILELCEFLDHFPDELAFVKTLAYNGTILQILHVLESRQDAKTSLWSTDETPGDDSVEHPFHFSSNLLLWRTFNRLAELEAKIGPSPGIVISKLQTLAENLRARTIASFQVNHPGSNQRMFAYLTDGAGACTFYHDANDVPTLFAEEWKFVKSPDELAAWTNTMKFGLSTANIAGFCSGDPYGGLGSVHSSGSWVLGYFQELGFSLAMNNTVAAADTWRRIRAAMQWDGTFPEAVDPRTAECTSKAWFSWPGSMIGSLIIHMRLTGQERHII